MVHSTSCQRRAVGDETATLVSAEGCNVFAGAGGMKEGSDEWAGPLPGMQPSCVSQLSGGASFGCDSSCQRLAGLLVLGNGRLDLGAMSNSQLSKGSMQLFLSLHTS